MGGTGSPGLNTVTHASCWAKADSKELSPAARAALSAFAITELAIIGVASLLFHAYDRGLNSQTSDRMLGLFGGVAEAIGPLALVVSVPVGVVTYVLVRLARRRSTIGPED